MLVSEQIYLSYTLFSHFPYLLFVFICFVFFCISSQSSLAISASFHIYYAIFLFIAWWYWEKSSCTTTQQIAENLVWATEWHLDVVFIILMDLIKSVWPTTTTKNGCVFHSFLTIAVFRTNEFFYTLMGMCLPNEGMPFQKIDYNDCAHL